jgi:CDGSH-type Zn-finger protein
MKITLVENGPIIVRTDAQVSVRVGANSESKRGPIALCRCGQSSTKPFCDGTHGEVGFEVNAGELDLGE